MAEITSVTKDRIVAIENAEIVAADIDSDGHFTLTRRDDEVIDGGSVPIGTPSGCVMMFAGDSLPAGWLMCTGQEVSRSAYPNLWTAIGTRYGSGNGTTTFNLPNLQARFPRMDTGSLAGTGGGATHVHTVANHSHTIADHTHVIADHSHSLSGGSPAGYAQVAISYSGAPNIFTRRAAASVPSWTSDQRGDVSTVQTTGSSITDGAGLGGKTAVDGNDTDAAGNDTDLAGSNADSASSLPPYLNLNFIIKT
jgi:microcystin-dependent protein